MFICRLKTFLPRSVTIIFVWTHFILWSFESSMTVTHNSDLFWRCMFRRTLKMQYLKCSIAIFLLKFLLFFSSHLPQRWLNALKPTINVECVYFVYFCTCLAGFNVGFTGNTGTVSSLDVFKLKEVPKRIIATTLTLQLECLTAKSRLNLNLDRTKPSDVDWTSEFH